MRKQTAKLLIILALVIFILCLTVPLLKNFVYKMIYTIEYEGYVKEFSAAYKLDKHLVYAVIYAESSYIPDAVSPAGAVGLMQIMPATGNWIASKLDIEYDEENKILLDPETNIHMGCWYLNYLSSKFNNNEALALAAYNAGGGNVGKWLDEGVLNEEQPDIDKIPFLETRNYVKKVQKLKVIYKELY